MFKMDQDLEYEENSARPKRRVRLPARYADYEVGQLGYQGPHYGEDAEIA